LTLYTIGYQNLSVENVMVALTDNRIRRLIDIRHRALSRKSGFSRGALEQRCQKAGLDYRHLPGLGVPTRFRRSLFTDQDFAELFDLYREILLPQAEGDFQAVGRLAEEQPSALLCFEADALKCHRSVLAERLAAEKGLDVFHL